jgi:PAS domain S-box-containing protein
VKRVGRAFEDGHGHISGRGPAADGHAETDAAILRTLLESAPVGFALFDDGLRFQRINRRMAEINGFSVEAHLGRYAFDLLPDLRSAEPVLRHVLDTGEPLVDVEVQGETPSRPGVTRFWLESFFPVHDDDGHRVGIAAVATEITDRKLLEGERGRLQEQVQRTLERLVAAQGAALDEVQRMLLPEIPDLEGLDVTARYLPVEQIAPIGGDWFDCFVLGDGRVALSVGDATGHGLPAVRTMDAAHNLMRAFLMTGADLGDTLLRTNEVLLRQGEFATAAVMVLDPSDGRLSAASAGHPPALVRRCDGTVEPLDEGRGPLFGAVDDPTYQVTSTTLAPGETVVLYTDGLVERRADPSIDTGIERLAEAMRADVGDTEALTDAVLAACVATGRDDDACVLVVSRR